MKTSPYFEYNLSHIYTNLIIGLSERLVIPFRWKTQGLVRPSKYALSVDSSKLFPNRLGRLKKMNLP